MYVIGPIEVKPEVFTIKLSDKRLPESIQIIIESPIFERTVGQT
jgi:hypothetical protein